jgi:predicted HAD superfamily Cof-like phosphohydrolase
MNYYQLVRDFQIAMGQPCADEPHPLDGDRRALRFNMLCAEFAELMCALYGIEPDDLICKGLKYNLTKLVREHLLEAKPGGVDFVNLARQMVDLHYVISGTAAEYGIPEDEAFEEVHRANMDKRGGPIRADGKQLPPEGWREPDIAAVFEDHQEWLQNNPK